MFNENVKSFRLRERTKWPRKRVTEMAAGQEDRRGTIDESIIIDRLASKLTWIDNTCYQAICIRFIIIIASWIYDTIYCHLEGDIKKCDSYITRICCILFISWSIWWEKDNRRSRRGIIKIIFLKLFLK